MIEFSGRKTSKIMGEGPGWLLTQTCGGQRSLGCRSAGLVEVTVRKARGKSPFVGKVALHDLAIEPRDHFVVNDEFGYVQIRSTGSGSQTSDSKRHCVFGLHGARVGRVDENLIVQVHGPLALTVCEDHDRRIVNGHTRAFDVVGGACAVHAESVGGWIGVSPARPETPNVV